MKNICLLILCLFFLGCMSMKNNAGNMAKYNIPEEEAEWIQKGKPIMFDNKTWYPQDRFDVLLDSEVYPKGEYQEVPFFVEKIDIYPYQKILTKFGRNKFRVYRAKE